MKPITRTLVAAAALLTATFATSNTAQAVLADRDYLIEVTSPTFLRGFGAFGVRNGEVRDLNVVFEVPGFTDGRYSNPRATNADAGGSTMFSASQLRPNFTAPDLDLQNAYISFFNNGEMTCGGAIQNKERVCALSPDIILLEPPVTLPYKIAPVPLPAAFAPLAAALSILAAVSMSHRRRACGP